MHQNVIFLQQGRRTKNGWEVQNNMLNDTSNTVQLSRVHSHEGIHGIEDDTNLSQRCLNSLEDVRKTLKDFATDIRKIERRVTRNEIDIRNNQVKKSDQGYTETGRNILDKI